jgi:hypothetical protein
MINFFRKLFNHDKIENLESGVDALLENNKLLEAEVREYKGYKLKYQVAMLQNDEAEFLELLEMAEKVEKYKKADIENSQRQLLGLGAQRQALCSTGLFASGIGSQLANQMAQQQSSLAQAQFGSLGAFRGFGGL